jgi:hypothetical protein
MKIKLSKRIHLFGGINRRLFIPYIGLKNKTKRGNTQSITFSPLRTTGYTKTKIAKFNIRTKTDLNSYHTKLKLTRKR